MDDLIYFIIGSTIIVFFIICKIGIYFYKKKEYEKTSYYLSTHIPYHLLDKDLGIYGEYLIYEYLRNYEIEGAKFLFNLYIPTITNKTTEIDVLMVSKLGIFVFESKNYSGWIFGTETQRKWTQCLHVGYGNTQKEHFFNPIMQNEYHIKHLKQLLNIDIPYYSVVVFSDRCEFKKIIRKNNSNTFLIHRAELLELFSDITKKAPKNELSSVKIEEIYNILHKYSEVDEQTKINHVKNLKTNN